MGGRMFKLKTNQMTTNDGIVNIVGLWQHKAWQHTVYSPEIFF